MTLRAVAEDPDGDELSYHWRLGDGERASGRYVRHTYRKRGTYVVRLVVSDRHGARTVAAARVFAGNTPPTQARILSPKDGYRYVAGRPVRLRAAARDPEDGRLRGRTFRWRVVLHHGDHNHYVGRRLRS